MTAPALAIDPADLVTVACTVCGMRLLVDPAERAARLHHFGDGAHRLIPAPRPSGAIAPTEDTMAIRVEVLGVAVRLRDLVDDLDAILARLSGVDSLG